MLRRTLHDALATFEATTGIIVGTYTTYRRGVTVGPTRRREGGRLARNGVCASVGGRGVFVSYWPKGL